MRLYPPNEITLEREIRVEENESQDMGLCTSWVKMSDTEKSTINGTQGRVGTENFVFTMVEEILKDRRTLLFGEE